MKRALMFSLVLTTSSTAFAQAGDATAPREVYKPVTEIEFDNLNIDGELVRPEIRMLTDVKRLQFASMIQLRSDFNVEMTESVSEVK